ncbi:MAG: acyl-CoA dehydratase activase [Planctomycetota bacterium]|jgi:predicted CoA-substrate-specific enzyme activase
MISAGVDAGSRAIKIVLIDADSKQVIAKAVTDQGVEQNKIALQLFERLLKDNGIDKEDVHRIVATGYGRNIVSIADTTITEITCQAVGVRQLLPATMTIIDIGGQDSKLVRLDRTGKVHDFMMNDRCAAGTGRFLEVVAERLEVDLHSLGEMAAKSKKPATISSMCVVFAETEIIGLLAAGEAKEDIVAGVQAAIATRIMAMAGRRIDLPIIFTGGVAMVSGMDAALQSALQRSVAVSSDPQMTGALGAAILAAEQLKVAKL